MENRVQRVPAAICGVQDGVELIAKCIHNTFLDDELKMKQVMLSCSMKADWTTGIMSIGFTLNGVHQSVCIRMDELLILLQEASKAREEAADKKGD